MARGTARRLLALGAAALVALQLAPAFVPAPRASPAREGAIAAGVIAAGYLNAMPALARIPGGKFEKAKDITMPAPPEDGLTDAQVALSLFVALLLMFANIKVSQALWEGPRVDRFRDGQTKGYITPLVRRLDRFGY
ncbi:unnamed protein product [Prorocentrum cordatum]|uniref:Uncharacterized protein n=1 Tax=Prorocentrum cordatum TaxID=2364126 RepID=A0ABN9PT53_9DINO|nr:unnamed protein product [Polarella glacialis]